MGNQSQLININSRSSLNPPFNAENLHQARFAGRRNTLNQLDLVKMGSNRSFGLFTTALENLTDFSAVMHEIAPLSEFALVLLIENFAFPRAVQVRSTARILRPELFDAMGKFTPVFVRTAAFLDVIFAKLNFDFPIFAVGHFPLFPKRILALARIKGIALPKFLLFSIAQFMEGKIEPQVLRIEWSVVLFLPVSEGVALSFDSVVGGSEGDGWILLHLFCDYNSIEHYSINQSELFYFQSTEQATSIPGNIQQIANDRKELNKTTVMQTQQMMIDIQIKLRKQSPIINICRSSNKPTNHQKRHTITQEENYHRQSNCSAFDRKIQIHPQTSFPQIILNNSMTNVDEGLVPETIKQKVHQVIALLLTHGIDHEQSLVQQQHEQYEFLLPKSKYYRYYTHQLFQHGPTSRERQKTTTPPLQRQVMKVEGNLETMSVGAMSEIVKEEISQGKPAYQPFENQTYAQQVTLDLHHPHLQLKVNSLIAKYGELLSKKNGKEIRGESGKGERSSSKMNEVRKQMGGNSDGSLGVYGGKRYEGLGVRDQFANFRREKSQTYYQNVRQKAQNQ